MSPLVRVRLEAGSTSPLSGRSFELRPGDVIGRGATASLRINDPRISEMHAVVSLRGLTLRLLGLRGRFAIGGTPAVDVVLGPGLEIGLTADITLIVIEVVLPERVLALETASHARLVPPSVASIDALSGELAPTVRHDAGALIWVDDEVLHLRVPGEPDRVLHSGEAFTVGAHGFRVATIDLADAALDTTAVGASINAPLVIHVRYDTVHVWRGDDVFSIDGMPARMLTELALIGVPAEWRTVARLVWPNETDDTALRHKWDSGLARLRKRLRETGLRKDLVRTDGGGRFELYLGPRDRVEDAT